LPVLQVHMPPCKLDILPETVARNVSCNYKGVRQILTGSGRHLFMGAITCEGDVEVVFSVTTVLGKTYFSLTRTQVREVPPQPESWMIGGVLVYSADNQEKWMDCIEEEKSAVVFIDGNYWWAPYERWVSVWSDHGKIMDRRRRVFGLSHELPNGVWEVNLDDDTRFRQTERPPISYELLRAWQKYVKLPPPLYANKLEWISEFRINRMIYDVSTVPYVFVTDSTLMSLHMVQNQRRPKGMRMMDFFFDNCHGHETHVNMFMFYKWSARRGILWAAHECYAGVNAAVEPFACFRVRVPYALHSKLIKCGASVVHRDVVWLFGVHRTLLLLVSLGRPSVKFSVESCRGLSLEFSV